MKIILFYMFDYFKTLTNLTRNQVNQYINYDILFKTTFKCLIQIKKVNIV